MLEHHMQSEIEDKPKIRNLRPVLASNFDSVTHCLTSPTYLKDSKTSSIFHHFNANRIFPCNMGAEASPRAAKTQHNWRFSTSPPSTLMTQINFDLHNSEPKDAKINIDNSNQYTSPDTSSKGLPTISPFRVSGMPKINQGNMNMSGNGNVNEPIEKEKEKDLRKEKKMSSPLNEYWFNFSRKEKAEPVSGESILVLESREKERQRSDKNIKKLNNNKKPRNKIAKIMKRSLYDIPYSQATNNDSLNNSLRIPHRHQFERNFQNIDPLNNTTANISQQLKRGATVSAIDSPKNKNPSSPANRVIAHQSCNLGCSNEIDLLNFEKPPSPQYTHNAHTTFPARRVNQIKSENVSPTKYRKNQHHNNNEFGVGLLKNKNNFEWDCRKMQNLLPNERDYKVESPIKLIEEKYIEKVILNATKKNPKLLPITGSSFKNRNNRSSLEPPKKAEVMYEMKKFKISPRSYVTLYGQSFREEDKKIQQRFFKRNPGVEQIGTASPKHQRSISPPNKFKRKAFKKEESLFPTGTSFDEEDIDIKIERVCSPEKPGDRITAENSSIKIQEFIKNRFHKDPNIITPQSNNQVIPFDEELYKQLKKLMPKVNFWQSTFGDKLLILHKMHQLEQKKYAAQFCLKKKGKNK